MLSVFQGNTSLVITTQIQNQIQAVIMSINLPTRLFAIVLRTEHKATYLHMTLSHAPRSIQLNTQENTAR